MSKEQPSSIKIFPVGNYASSRAFQEFSQPKSVEDSMSVLSKELKIMEDHYLVTIEYVAFTKSLFEQFDNSVNPNSIVAGMGFMHLASRLEANAKRTILPAISQKQQVQYLLNSGVWEFDTTFNPVGFNVDSLLVQFRTQELSLQRTLTPMRRSYHSNINDFEAGAGLMWDFLKKAPTLA